MILDCFFCFINLFIMEEFEVLDLEDLRKDKGMKKTMKMLKSKLTQGYKVSIMIKKLFCFKLPPLQTKKNNFFSKTHHPIEIVIPY